MTVTGASTVVEMQLRRVTTLREIEVVGQRTGVYGTVMGRDSLKPLEGARVEVLGARARDTTDGAGAFAMNTERVGTFMLRVTRDGYDTRLLSVRVPKDTGVGIDIGLKPGTPLDFPVAVNSTPLPLEPGRYEWRLTIDGGSREDWTLPFTVRGEEQ